MSQHDEEKLEEEEEQEEQEEQQLSNFKDRFLRLAVKKHEINFRVKQETKAFLTCFKVSSEVGSFLQYMPLAFKLHSITLSVYFNVNSICI